MNIIYKDVEDNGLFMNEPLTYRISIYSENDNIILKREYFRVGFGHEQLDIFYKEYEYDKPLVSIITRIFDKKYLNKLEKDIFKVYVNYLNETNIKINEDKERYSKYINSNINIHNNMIKFISSIKRKEKIKKILNDK